MKKCNTCKITKKFSEFYVKTRKENKIYYRSRCKKCTYSSLTPKQKTNKIETSRLYYEKNKKKILAFRKKQRKDPLSTINKYKKKGKKSWTNSIFDKLMMRLSNETKLKSTWIKKIEKIYSTNKDFENKRISIIATPKTPTEIYINWKKEYSKRLNWKNRKEKEFLYEFCYRRITRALSNKTSNVNQNLWEIRFNSVSSFMRLRA